MRTGGGQEGEAGKGEDEMKKEEAIRRRDLFNTKSKDKVKKAQRMRENWSAHISWLPCGLDPVYQDGRGRCGHCWDCILLETE